MKQLYLFILQYRKVYRICISKLMHSKVMGVQQLAVAILLICVICGPGCAPLKDVGDNIGETIGEVTDELGKEQKVGKGDDVLIIHPQDDKKIKMPF